MTQKHVHMWSSLYVHVIVDSEAISSCSFVETQG